MDIQFFQGEFNIGIELFGIYYLRNNIHINKLMYPYIVYENKFIYSDIIYHNKDINYAITNNNTYVFYYIYNWSANLHF